MKPHTDKPTLIVMLIAVGFITLGVMRPSTGGSCSLLSFPGILLADAPGTLPHWEMRNLAGEAVTSEAFAGKWQVISFWTTWCPYCRAEWPELVALQKDHPDLQVLAINIEGTTPDAAREFLARRETNFPVLIADESVNLLFGGIASVPTTLLAAPDGTIVARFEGFVSREELTARIKDS